jgi:hypothetical protein
MIATIALDDGLILPHSANPTGSNFRERHPAMKAGIGATACSVLIVALTFLAMHILPVSIG